MMLMGGWERIGGITVNHAFLVHLAAASVVTLLYMVIIPPLIPCRKALIQEACELGKLKSIYVILIAPLLKRGVVRVEASNDAYYF